MPATARKIDLSHDPIEQAAIVVAAADRLVQAGKLAVAKKLADAKNDMDALQHTAHGLAWFATYALALKQMHDWATRLQADGRFGEIEVLILEIGVAEYAAQLSGGIAMNQGELIRPEQLGIAKADIRAFADAVEDIVATGTADAPKARLAALIAANPTALTYGDSGLDETHAAMHQEMHRFAVAEVLPHAHQWHLDNAYIPLDIIAKLADLGVFGVSMPEEWGGLGLGKEAMCVVSEELSRGYIGVGSLGTG
jgi:(2S)-methylsuccinyl-CoA dehydrogenase